MKTIRKVIIELLPPLRGPLLSGVLAVIALFTVLLKSTWAGDPVSVVVLPPQASETLSGSSLAEAQLLCDQLSSRLAEDHDLHVVDRTQIEKVLAEKAVGGSQGPILAYDAMLSTASQDIPGKSIFHASFTSNHYGLVVRVDKVLYQVEFR